MIQDACRHARPQHPHVHCHAPTCTTHSRPCTPSCPQSDANKGGQRGRPSNLLAGLQQALRGAEKVDASRKRLQVKNRQLKAQLASKTSELRQLQIQVCRQWHART